MTEIFALDLDWDFVLHIARPASLDVLRSERFPIELLEDDLAKTVYQWQLDHLRKHGVPATPSVLEDQFPDLRFEDPQTTIGDLIERLRNRYAKNEGRKAIREISKGDPSTFGAEMLRRGKELTEITSSRSKEFGTGDYEKAKKAYNKILQEGVGPTLGFKDLDDKFGGMKGLTFILGAVKSLKSWFTINNVIEGVIAGDHPYLYSLELPAEDSQWRMYCMAANIPYWKYEQGKLSLEEIKIIENAAKRLDEHGIYHISKPAAGERDVYMLVEGALAKGADYILIDQLQYVEVPGKTSLGALNDTKYYWQVIEILKDYSDTIPIFIVHQFNRSVLGSTEMPEVQQAKGSAAVDEAAHLVLGLWSSKEMRKNNIVELGTLASRSYGSHTSWNLEYNLSQECYLECLGEAMDDE